MAIIEELARSFESNEIATVSLDNTTKTFFVQHAVLLNASPYFVKALSNGFKETCDRTLRLPGCDEETFQCFLYWLCHHHIISHFHLQPEKEDRDDYPDVYPEQLVRLWAFGDACLRPRLQNAVMKQIAEHYSGDIVAVSTVELTYKITEPDSVLRSFIPKAAVDNFGDGSREPYVFDELGAIPDFMGNFVDALLECRGFKCNSKGHCSTCSAAKSKEASEKYFVAEIKQ